MTTGRVESNPTYVHRGAGRPWHICIAKSAGICGTDPPNRSWHCTCSGQAAPQTHFPVARIDHCNRSVSESSTLLLVVSFNTQDLNKLAKTSQRPVMLISPTIRKTRINPQATTACGRNPTETPCRSQCRGSILKREEQSPPTNNLWHAFSPAQRSPTNVCRSGSIQEKRNREIRAPGAAERLPRLCLETPKRAREQISFHYTSES